MEKRVMNWSPKALSRGGRHLRTWKRSGENRVIDRGLERDGNQRADAGNSHQPPANLVFADNPQHLAVQLFDSRESAALAYNIAVVIRSSIAWPAESSRARASNPLCHDANLQSKSAQDAPHACL
jgi:hypothetical protein